MMDNNDLAILASRSGFGYAERIGERDLDPSLLERVPLAFVKANLALPMRIEAGRLKAAVAGPASLFALDDFSRIFAMPIDPIFVPSKQILDAANRHYERTSGTAEEVIGELDSESLDAIAHRLEEPKDLLELADEAPIIRLLNSLLFQAVKERASDIHIEPFERTLDVRFRRDGVLYPIITPPKVVQDSLCTRVKVMAGLDIAEKRLPQDGRIRLLVAGKDIDVRVSVVPTSFGERVVLRLLDRRKGAIGLADLGMEESSVTALDSLLKRNHGIILSTGPTGSGKTTTLYASINRINTNERNVITIEDPVEYQLSGVGQIQVNSKIGLTFGSGLRSILRQDPDVIMVGEIRDMETAEMAIQASLTGHLVLSTLHTNDAPSAITRLVDMGVQSYLLSSSLAAVLAQRLVRVLCRECAQAYVPSNGERALLGIEAETLWRPRGCSACLDTGYAGQTAIYEFMTVDDGLRQLLLKSSDSTTIKAHALSRGMRTLKDEGMLKAASGITSIEEVMRVTSA